MDIKLLQERIDKELLDLDLGVDPVLLYDPIRYTLSIGGKRMRPVFLLLASELFGEDYEQALPAALAIEVFHNFTLIHDDLMDDAPLRRKIETVHVKWSPNVAILSGDAMMVKAYQLLAQSETTKLKVILDHFNEAAFKVCEGQQLDMEFESNKETSLTDYMKMIELKTSALLSVSLQIGGIIGGGGTSDIQCLFELGKNIGIAFQLQDDVLDVFGESEKFGKQRGGDIISGKKTYLYLKALELSDKDQALELKELMTNNDLGPAEKVDKVSDIYGHLNVIDAAKSEITKFHKMGMQNLDEISADSDRKRNLINVCNSLMVREL